MIKNCVMRGTKIKRGTCLLKWYWFYSYLLYILLRIKSLFSYGLSCFLLEIAILRGPQLTTQSPSSYGISCFLLEIAIIRGPPFTTPSPSFYGISCFLLKIDMGMVEFPPLCSKIPSQWTCFMLILNILRKFLFLCDWSTLF